MLFRRVTLVDWGKGSRFLHVVFNLSCLWFVHTFRYLLILVCPKSLPTEETDNKETINTINYPNAYPGNLRCVWNIRLSESSTIKLDFKPKYQFSCDNDILRVYDSGPSSDLIPFNPWCKDLPKFIFSSGPKMRVEFMAAGKSNEMGFMATIRYIKKNAGTVFCLFPYMHIYTPFSNTHIAFHKFCEESQRWGVRYTETIGFNRNKEN